MDQRRRTGTAEGAGDAAVPPRSLGHLNPGDPHVAFDRFAVGPGLDELVRHVWLVRWSVPAGPPLAQRSLSYPAVNIVVEPHRAALYGPDPRVDVRELAGESWALGILFRPAAGTLLTATPALELVGRGEPVDGPWEEIRSAVDAGGDREAIGAILDGLLSPVASRVDADGLRVNEVCRVAEEDDGITRSAELADAVGLSVRALERLVRTRVGVAPKWLIECRRLQQAATRLFGDPDTDLAVLADRLGYVDQAHLTRRYRRFLGETPGATRRAGAAGRARLP